MSETPARSGTPEASPPRPLDDVLMAMDVVDTLRHREQLVARELDAEGRERELIGRLKEIYAAQGIDVPESILKDGVKALEEQRFVYTPPGSGLGVRLARLYVSRDRWLKPVAAGIAAIVIGLGVWQFGVVAPRQAAQGRLERELGTQIPAQLDTLLADILAVASEPGVAERAGAMRDAALQAARAGEAGAARDGLAALQTLKRDLEAVYTVRVVYGPDERYSGVFRIPENVPNARNYYLIVEAVDAAGRLVSVPIDSEEDRRSARVTRWGQRVSKAAFDAVAADKSDDQIIQRDVIGQKPSGRLTPLWTVDTPGGAILEW